jgi:hypothetical protein
MRRLGISAIAVLLLLGAGLGGPGSGRARRYDPLKLGDLEAMAEILRRHVALVETPAGAGPITREGQEGLAVAIGPRRLASHSALFEGTTRAKVTGPGGSLEAVLVRLDPERRFAWIETAEPIEKIGLYPALAAPRRSAAPDQAVFALPDLAPRAGLLTGVVTHDGSDDWLEGHPRITLKLSGGTPVFDDRARLLGIARQMRADVDPLLVVPLWTITARTATTSDPPGPDQTRPWWAR